MIDSLQHLHVTLSSVSTVRSGILLARKQAKKKSEYRYFLLTLKSFNQNAFLESEYFDVFDATEALGKEYLTMLGDVVIRLSSPYTAVLIDETTSNCVISSNFALVRTDKTKVLPEFLYWYLNTDSVKAEIRKNNGRSMLGTIHTQFYNDLKIQLPSLQQQKIIADLYALSLQESSLLKKLAEEKAKYHKEIIQKTYNQFTGEI